MKKLGKRMLTLEMKISESEEFKLLNIIFNMVL